MTNANQEREEHKRGEDSLVVMTSIALILLAVALGVLVLLTRG